MRGRVAGSDSRSALRGQSSGYKMDVLRELDACAVRLVRAVSVAIVFVGFLGNAGCSRACHDTEFDAWSRADRIIVSFRHQGTTHTLRDPAQISRIVAFAQAHEDGWGNPWYGTPIGSITLTVYAGDHFLGHLDIGRTFLEAQGCDAFMSRSLSRTDRLAILSLLGLPEGSVQ